MSKQIRRLLEFAMELGDTPDSIHPYHKRALATGQGNPLAKNPAYPPHTPPGMNPHEKQAVATYKNIYAKLRDYGGYMPRSQRDIGRAAVDMYNTLTDLQDRESAVQDELEQLAVETVLRMPEFKTLRRPIRSGQVKIEPYLNRRININGVQFQDTPKPQLPGAEIEQIQQEYDEQIHKRKMLNTLTQGAAVANNYAFAFYVRQELMDIDPTLVQDYGKLMAYIELGYFTQDPQLMKQAAQAGGSEGQGGDERLKRNDDGSISIVARGITFPILVHEIVKGCMEYLSHSDEDDPETRMLVNKHADNAEDEMVQLQLGPTVYNQFIAAIGHPEAMPYVHDMLVKMPASEFNQKMQGLMAGTPEGKQWFQQAAQRIKQQLDAQDAQDAQGQMGT